MTSHLKNDCSNPPWQIDFAKIFSNCGKKVKQEVTKFGSHSLNGFRVAANTMVVWDKNPPSLEAIGLISHL